MASPYQSLGCPQSPLIVVNDESCGCPDCVSCCCCAKPGCCMRPGAACPCFCTKSAAAFSLTLLSFWLALPLLISSHALPDLFTARGLDNACPANLALSPLCGAPLVSGTSGLDAWSSLEVSTCEANTIDAPGVSGVQHAAFNALRSLVAASTALTLVAAILSPLRLAAQQRSPLIAAAMSGALIAVMLLAFISAAAAVLLGYPVLNAVHSDTDAARGSAWTTLTAGVGMLAMGLLLHYAAIYSYQASLAHPLNGQPGVDAPAVTNPIATVNSTSPPLTHSIMTTAPRADVPVQLIDAR